jgi:hypothetical protein
MDDQDFVQGNTPTDEQQIKLSNQSEVIFEQEPI